MVISRLLSDTYIYIYYICFYPTQIFVVVVVVEATARLLVLLAAMLIPHSDCVRLLVVFFFAFLEP